MLPPSNSDDHTVDTPLPLDARATLDDIVAWYLQQLNSQYPVLAERLIQSYPHFQPRLEEHLHGAELIHRARNAVETIPQPPANHLPPTRQLGRFDLLECVGTGGFGSVWKAVDRQLRRIVAIKLPHSPLTVRNHDTFLREARIAAQVRHPHIVAVHEIGTWEGLVYIVSDFIDGVPLNVWASQQQPSLTESAELCYRLSSAIQVAHALGIVHRDLKPANILMQPSGDPAITDFGLAKQAFDEETIKRCLFAWRNFVRAHYS